MAGAVPADGPVRLYAVEDDARQLRALRKQLSGEPSVRLVGATGSGEAALRELQGQGVDLVLMDLELPGLGGVETTRLLRARDGAPDVLVLTSYEDEESVFAAMRAGAAGYVVKGAPLQRLLRAIADVAAGGTVIEPRLARRFWAFFQGLRGQVPGAPPLSAIEEQILSVLAKGLSNGEVAQVVGLDRRTVRTHLGHLYRRFGVRSHVELVVAALKLGLVQP